MEQNRMTFEHLNQLRGDLRENERLSRHTSWRVGGEVKRFYQPADIEDLSLFLRMLPGDEPVYWIGLGSNLLVRDRGYNGTIICTSGVLNTIELLEGERLYVEAGVACPKAAKFSAKHALTDAEFLCGIPGTMGGALAMNAGAFGGETWDVVESVEMIDHTGQRHTYPPTDFEIAYRHVTIPPKQWFVSCVLKLRTGNAAASQEKIKALLQKRGATQPTQQPNAGSVFRNPANDYAARLIESCGLKGMCIGGACVSEKHANFIVNTGTATAADIEQLINKVQQTVLEETGIALQMEVKILGDE